MTGNNDIDNVNVSQKRNYIDIDNDKYEKSKNVERIADRLMEKLGPAKTSRPFMCKVALKLSESRIWSNLEQTQSPTVTNPIGLFIYLCKRDGV